MSNLKFSRLVIQQYKTSQPVLTPFAMIGYLMNKNKKLEQTQTHKLPNFLDFIDRKEHRVPEERDTALSFRGSMFSARVLSTASTFFRSDLVLFNFEHP